MPNLDGHRVALPLTCLGLVWLVSPCLDPATSQDHGMHSQVPCVCVPWSWLARSWACCCCWTKARQNQPDQAKAVIGLLTQRVCGVGSLLLLLNTEGVWGGFAPVSLKCRGVCGVGSRPRDHIPGALLTLSPHAHTGIIVPHRVRGDHCFLRAVVFMKGPLRANREGWCGGFTKISQFRGHGTSLTHPPT